MSFMKQRLEVLNGSSSGGKKMGKGQQFGLIGGLVLLVAAYLLFNSFFYIVPPGYRGVMVTLGTVSDRFLPEGFGFKAPLITSVHEIMVKQRNSAMKSECFSSDLQHINIDIRLLFRIPEASVVRIFREFAGDPFDNLVSPRVNEALKEVTAMQNAESIVKKREEVKTQALEIARKKIGDVIMLDDLVIEDIQLSKELAHAIEQKMVQEQEAAKSKFIQQKAEVEAKTAVIRAKGEAEAISIRGRALRESPTFIQLQIVEKWDGKSPLVVGSGGSGTNMILPLDAMRKTASNP